MTQLMDLNGDGIADNVYVQPGPGNDGGRIGAVLSSGNQLRATSSDFFPKGTGGVPVFGKTGSFGLGINLGYSGAADSFGGGTGVQARRSGANAILADFTGDGRPDLIEPAGDKLLVYPNLGSGFAQEALSFSIGGSALNDLATSETTLVDAGGFFTHGFSWFTKYAFTIAGQASTSKTRELVAMRDMNGDHYNLMAKAHLLASIVNPAGSRIELKYGLFGNSGPENGSPVWALTNAIRFDGFDTKAPLNGTSTLPSLPSDGQDILLANYSYGDGYYNRAERLFYGFARRTTTFYGCDGAANCLAPTFLAANDDAGPLAGDYVPLQRIDEDYANGDFYSQGTLLTRTVSGVVSAVDASHAEPPLRGFFKSEHGQRTSSTFTPPAFAMSFQGRMTTRSR